jgi:prevent-host-death family protein
MDQVSVFDAKNQLSALLNQVEHGREVTITRRGKPMAKLVPASAHSRARGAVEAIRTLRQPLPREAKACPGKNSKPAGTKAGGDDLCARQLGRPGLDMARRKHRRRRCLACRCGRGWRAGAGALAAGDREHPAERAWRETIGLAAAHDLTVYDACTLELSLRLSLPLATLDRALGQAASACGVRLAL